MSLETFMQLALKRLSARDIYLRLCACGIQIVRALTICGNAIHRNIQEFTAIQVSNPFSTTTYPRFVLCDFSRAIILAPGDSVPDDDQHVPYFGKLRAPPEWPTKKPHKGLDFWCLGLTLRRMHAMIDEACLEYESRLTRADADYHQAQMLFVPLVNALNHGPTSQRGVCVSRVIEQFKLDIGNQIEKWCSSETSSSETRAEGITWSMQDTSMFERPGVFTYATGIAKGTTKWRAAQIKGITQVVGYLGRLRQDMHPNLPRLLAAYHLEHSIHVHAELDLCAVDTFCSVENLLACGLRPVIMALQACRALQHCHEQIEYMLRKIRVKDVAVGGTPRRLMLQGAYHVSPIRPGWRLYTRFSKPAPEDAPELFVRSKADPALAEYCESVDLFAIGSMFARAVPGMAPLASYHAAERPTLLRVIDDLEQQLKQTLLCETASSFSGCWC
jgi:hypothetical protein